MPLLQYGTSYLKQIPNIPLFPNHIVVSFALSDSSRFAMHHDFLNNKTHSFESVQLLPILPYCVIVYLMHPVD